MASVLLKTMVRYCDRLLNSAEIEDWPGAVNGLQVENRGKVKRIAAAVDASLTTIQMALEARANLLVVHHGLFWQPSHPWTGKRFELIRSLMDGDLAVYSSHLPLDVHPRLGNNAELCRALGWRKTEPFFFDKGGNLGLRTTARMHRRDLGKRLTKVLGIEPTLLPGGRDSCQKIGVVTGGAGAELKLAADEGIDTFITGEGPHWTFSVAEELGINVFYGGHYATETFGVKALAAHLSKKFGLPWSFVDHPSGL